MTQLDWWIVAAYLGIIIILGLYAGRREEDMEDYFLGGRNIPWWAAMLSLVATEISAATFLGAPEQGYTRDLTYLQFGIGSILARIVLAAFFIGVFYRLRVYTVYAFLNSRFGFSTKSTAAAAFLLGRLFAGGSRMFIASLAVKVVTGYDLVTSIVLLGLIATLYTIFGGIKAVIWTDVIQAIVLILGAFLSIYFLYQAIPYNLPDLIHLLNQNDKLKLLDTDTSEPLKIFSNAYHFIPAILGGFFLTMATHGTDQSMIQRLLTCRDSLEGKRSMVLSGFTGVGVTVLFMVVGFLLFALVESSAADPLLMQISKDLAANGQNGNFYLHYIVLGLPPGISGLIIAAIVAAAMSSIDSELNAMSSAIVSDLVEPIFLPGATDKALLRIAKVFTLINGALLMGVAVLIADFYEQNPDTDLLSIALGVMTLFYGGLLGIFLLGLFTKARGSNLSTISALILSTVTIIFISYKQLLLEYVALVDPQNPEGFLGAVYEFQLAWPWFIILGTVLSVTIAIIGRTPDDQQRHFDTTLQEA